MAHPVRAGLAACVDLPAHTGRNAANLPPLGGDLFPREICRCGTSAHASVPAADALDCTGAVSPGKSLSALQAFLLMLLTCVPLALGAAGAAHAQDRHAALVIDANNGHVMHADKADEIRFPASLTKIMTLYMAFEAIEQGRTSYTTRIKVSHEAASQPPTKLVLEPGETIALGDAMKALVTKSANDAAVAIAEHLGGTEARFARMMTEKARLFGMSRTTFRNASGLPDPEQVTTARDMARLALRIQDDFPRHYPIFALRTFNYDGSHYRNHNNLLFRFQGTDGIKTGYTRASGFNLVSSVRRGGRHVVGVIFGGATASRRDVTMQLLLARALNQASPYKTRRSAPVLIAAPAQRTKPQQVAAAPAVTVSDAERPRPVMVPPRPRQESAGSENVSRFTQAVPAPVPAVRPQHLRSTSSPDDARTAANPRQSEAPASPRHAPTSAAVPAHAAPAQQPRPAPAVQIAAARPAEAVRPPSTFQQQASTLGRPPEPAASAHPRPQAPMHPMNSPPRQDAASASAGGSFDVQIGAYGSAAEAERALNAARTSAGDVLGASAGRAIPIAKETRQVWRARFVGFDSRTAANTCIELRRRQIDCFVMRAE